MLNALFRVARVAPARSRLFLPGGKQTWGQARVASHHEDFEDRAELVRSSERSFGIVMAVALTALAWWKGEEWGPVVGWMFGVGAVFGVTALLMPRVLRPLNTARIRIGIV